MQPTPGRRELNKQRTRREIRRCAMELFIDRGFDTVTTLEIAEAAAVSPATIFNYFPTKEDLFFGQVEELERRLTELVLGVPTGESILTALQGHVIYELTAGRATTDPPAVATFHSVLIDSPRLRAREATIYERRAGVLADALEQTGQDALIAAVAARQYIAAEQLVAAEMRRRMTRPSVSRRVLRDLDAFIAQVFEIIRTGVGELAPAAPRSGRRRT